MLELFPYLLFLHILGAIVAFGPGFAAPISGLMAGQEPMHANFATRLTERVTRGITVPLAIVQGITGVLLIWSGQIDPTSQHWLAVGILLYLIAIGFAIFVQLPNVGRLVELTTVPAGGPPPGAPAGPPPGVSETVRRVQQGGIVLTVLIIAIVALMVIRPTF